jgi:hypothetical protein
MVYTKSFKYVLLVLIPSNPLKKVGKKPSKSPFLRGASALRRTVAQFGFPDRIQLRDSPNEPSFTARHESGISPTPHSLFPTPHFQDK